MTKLNPGITAPVANVYWTCTSAGVIVKLSGGKTEVIARDLKSPTGLATNYLGNLYFSEVPTPGVSGANSGSNKVSKLKLSSGAITVINEGDPDPIAVVASRGAEAGRPVADDGAGLPLPAGHQQVEQDRTPVVQPHLDQLAWPAADEPGPDRAVDQIHDDNDGFAGACGHRPVPVSEGAEGDEGNAGDSAVPTGIFPRRVELPHHPRKKL
jgi:hypothetical protein